MIKKYKFIIILRFLLRFTFDLIRKITIFAKKKIKDGTGITTSSCHGRI